MKKKNYSSNKKKGNVVKRTLNSYLVTARKKALLKARYVDVSEIDNQATPDLYVKTEGGISIITMKGTNTDEVTRILHRKPHQIIADKLMKRQLKIIQRKK